MIYGNSANTNLYSRIHSKITNKFVLYIQYITETKT